MGSEVTIEAVRLAMGIEELKARAASINIANAGKPDARALRFDLESVQATLLQASRSGDANALRAAGDALASLEPVRTGAEIRPDEQVGDMSVAGLRYQALGEALSRRLGLMRLAITGRN